MVVRRSAETFASIGTPVVMNSSSPMSPSMAMIAPVPTREHPHETRLAEPGESVAQLGLEHHDRRERAVGEDDAQQRADHRELREHRDEVGERQDDESDDDLERPGPDEEQEKTIDDERDEQDLEDVRPETR